MSYYPQYPYPAAAVQPSYPAYSYPAQPSVRQGGRTVGSPDEITVQEVPTDGTPAYFSLSDGSAIVAKRWLTDGSIETVKYVREGETKPAKPVQLGDISAKLDSALSKLDELMAYE